MFVNSLEFIKVCLLKLIINGLMLMFIFFIQDFLLVKNLKNGLFLRKFFNIFLPKPFYIFLFYLFYMIDIVFPKNNEQEFIDLASKLGFSSLVFVYDKPNFREISSKKVKIHYALLLPIAKLNIARSKKLLAFYKGHSHAREAIERGFDVVFAVEDDPRPDHLHFRNSGLNHVLCRFAHKNKVKIGFSFSDILNSNNCHILLGRIMQNIRFCRKFKVPMLIASFAKTPFEMRSFFELRAFFEVLGMTSKESASALDWI